VTDICELCTCKIVLKL